MPLLNATSIPYTGVPTTSAPLEVRGDFQNIQANPEAFGASAAQGLQRLGGTFDRAGDSLAAIAIQRQEIFNQVVATDASNQVTDTWSKILYGDPAKGDRGFYGTQGETALREFGPTRDRINQAFETARSQLQNPRQQLAFDGEMRRQRSYTLNDMGRHYDKEFKTYTNDTFNAQQHMRSQGVASAAAQEDDDRFNRELGGQIQSIYDQGNADGWSQYTIDAKVGSARAAAVKAKVASLDANGHSRDALTYLQNNEDAVDKLEYPELVKSIKKNAINEEANKAVQGLIRGGAMNQPHLNYGNTGALGDPNEPGWAAKNLTTVSSSSGATFQVNKAAAADVKGFLADLEKTGYKINPVESGGYNLRKMRDSDQLSEHAFGTAIDINSTQNLYSKDGRRVTNLPTNVAEIAARHNMEWGGNWTDPVDAMHFQWRGPAAANNLGGIRAPGPVRTKAEGGFASYPTPEAGVQAISDNLDRYAAGGVVTETNPTGKPLTTLGDIVSVWAPPSENNTAELIQRASATTGFSPDQQLDLKNPEVKAKVIEAVIRNEQGNTLPVPQSMIQKVAATGGPDTLFDKRILTVPPEDTALPDSAVPGLQQRLRDLAKTIPENKPEVFDAAVKKMRSQMNMEWMNHQREKQIIDQVQKEESRKAEESLLDRFGKGDVPTPQDVIASNVATEKKTGLISWFNREMAEGPVPSGVSANNLVDIVAKIQNKEITDPDVVTSLYAPGRQINEKDWQVALKALKDRHDPGQAAAQDSFARLKHELQPVFYGPSMIKDLAPLQMRMNEYRWDQDVREMIGAEQKAGRTGADLFNYKNPNFVGGDEFMKKYSATVEDLMKDHEKEATKPLDLSTQQKIFDLYDAKKIDKEGALNALEKLGVPRRKVQPASGVPLQ